MIKRLLLVAAAALLLSSCVLRQPNPAYDKCVNACTAKQDSCMLNATTSATIDSCKSRLEQCVNRCISTYPQWITPK